MIIPTRSQIGEYDSWADIDDDGKINMYDIGYSARLFGTEGDPTKNVNVTNWPVEQELFPENLVLRATLAYYPYALHMLLDETTPYPQARKDYDGAYVGLNTSVQSIYNQTFVYMKMPTTSYAISGLSQVSLSYNLTNSPYATFYTITEVYLGKMSISDQWTELLFLGGQMWSYQGGFSNYNNQLSFVSSLNTLQINANERLAIRVITYAYADSATNLTYYLMLRMNTNDFLVDIPIIKNP